MIKLAFISFIAGVATGFFGIGAGMVLIPILIELGILPQVKKFIFYFFIFYFLFFLFVILLNNRLLQLPLRLKLFLQLHQLLYNLSF